MASQSAGKWPTSSKAVPYEQEEEEKSARGNIRNSGSGHVCSLSLSYTQSLFPSFSLRSSLVPNPLSFPPFHYKY